MLYSKKIYVKMIQTVFHSPRFFNCLLFQAVVLVLVTWLIFHSLKTTNTGNSYSYFNVQQKSLELRKGLLNIDGSSFSLITNIILKSSVVQFYQGLFFSIMKYLDDNCEVGYVSQRLGPLLFQICSK